MLYLFVGNSGAGKDTIMREAAKLTNAKIAKRYITRPPSPETEDFYSISDEEFDNKLSNFCLQWESYGNKYGIDNKTKKMIESGETVFANVSRDVVEKAKNMWPNTKIIFISVPIETTIIRLKNRKRDEKTIQERIKRAKNNVGKDLADLIVENDGNINNAVEKVINYIQKK